MQGHQARPAAPRGARADGAADRSRDGLFRRPEGRAFKRQGLTPIGAKREPAVFSEEFIALVAGTTMSLTEIAERIGVSLQAVLFRARSLGLKTSLRDRGAVSRIPKKISDEQLRAAVTAGRSTAEIAKAYDMSRASVWKRSRALGLLQAAAVNQ